MDEARPVSPDELRQMGYALDDEGGVVALTPPLTSWGYAHRLPADQQWPWLQRSRRISLRVALSSLVLFCAALTQVFGLPNVHASIVTALYAATAAAIGGPGVLDMARKWRFLSLTPISRGTILRAKGTRVAMLFGATFSGAITLACLSVRYIPSQGDPRTTRLVSICYACTIAMTGTQLLHGASCMAASHSQRFLPSRRALVVALASVQVLGVVAFLILLYRL